MANGKHSIEEYDRGFQAFYLIDKRSLTMKYLRQLLSYLSLTLIPLNFTLPALAATRIDIDSETNSFRERKIQSGAIEVVVNYRQLMLGGNDSSDNLSYKIFYNGKLQIKASTYTSPASGEVLLRDLDSDSQPEVIVKTFSGGAHCCTSYRIYSWQKNQFVSADMGFRDGIGGEFTDIDGDNLLEFLTYDNSFLYTFSSYAGSYPPSLIYRFSQGKLENVTRQYPEKLRETANKMYDAVTAVKQGGEGEINGILAGYVAQKILLGEYQDAWKFMLDNYDLKSQNGLDIYEGDRKIGEYPNFPAALKAFLVRHDYLDKNGKPYPIEVDN
jgi:hypothetical protein